MVMTIKTCSGIMRANGGTSKTRAVKWKGENYPLEQHESHLHSYPIRGGKWVMLGGGETNSLLDAVFSRPSHRTHASVVIIKAALL